MSIPWMILGETSLSFLGLGLRPPVISWGLLQKAAEHTLRRFGYLASLARSLCRYSTSVLQLRRRWPARCGQSLC